MPVLSILLLLSVQAWYLRCVSYEYDLGSCSFVLLMLRKTQNICNIKFIVLCCERLTVTSALNVYSDCVIENVTPCGTIKCKEIKETHPGGPRSKT